MIKSKKIDYSNKTLDFGFVEQVAEKGISFDEIVKEVKDNLFLVDTDNYFLESSLPYLADFLNQDRKILIGLVDERGILTLSNNGVNNGFFRSTASKINLGIIIVDKRKIYISFDIDHIYPLKDDSFSEEIFNYVNHILWSKAMREKCQRNVKDVKDARLSVIKPDFKNTPTYDNSIRYDSVYKELGNNAETILLSKEENINYKSKVMLKGVKSYEIKGSLYLNLFEDVYYPIDADKIYKSISFSKEKISNLSNKNIWFGGKKHLIKESDTIKTNVSVPLDEVMTYEPNFEEIAEGYDGITNHLQVEVDVKSLKLDGSYAKSNKYKKIDNIEDDINEALNKIENLSDEKSANKQIKTIRDEHLLKNKIRFYNKFINDNEFGIEALNNKKAFPNINVNESDLIVPPEIIGTLYTKGGKDYLATTEDRIKEAKEWLKENKVNATLIEI